MTDNEKRLGNDALDVLNGLGNSEITAKIGDIREMVNQTNLEDGWVVSIIGDPISSPALISGSIRTPNLTVAEAAHAQGNWFATMEEAKKESKRRIVIQKLRDIAGSQDWIDWDDEDKKKWYLEYRTHAMKWECDYMTTIRPEFTMPYFKTVDHAYNAIAALSEELDILL